MYGKSLAGENLDWEEATTLLPMADFFLMDDLKDAAIPVIGNLLSLDNILEAAELAVKHSKEKLKEVCCDFALSRIPPNDHSNELLQKLILILPIFGLRQGGITCEAIGEPRKSSKAIDKRVNIYFRDKNEVFI